MTREQTKEAIRVMQAYVDGREVECKHLDAWARIDQPSWNWVYRDYRIKPTKTMRPWTADEVPVGGQIRSKESRDYRFLIDQTANADVREDWLKGYEHSTDGGKTWLPCGVVEESK